MARSWLLFKSEKSSCHSKNNYKELNNEFPNSYSGLIKLKGIGDYTASAIASFCYNAPCAVVDGNVYRVLSRIFGIDTPINSSKGIKLFKSLAEDKLNKVDSAIHNQAIMEFGALQCKPKPRYVKPVLLMTIAWFLEKFNKYASSQNF